MSDIVNIEAISLHSTWTVTIDEGWQFDIRYDVEKNEYKLQRAINPAGIDYLQFIDKDSLPTKWEERLNVLIAAIEEEKLKRRMCFRCGKQKNECECRNGKPVERRSIYDIEITDSIAMLKEMALRSFEGQAIEEVIEYLYDELSSGKNPICNLCHGRMSINSVTLENNMARFLIVLVNCYLEEPRWFHYRERQFLDEHFGGGKYASGIKYGLIRQLDDRDTGFYKPTELGIKWVYDNASFMLRYPCYTYKNRIIGWGSKFRTLDDALGAKFTDTVREEDFEDLSEFTIVDALSLYRRELKGEFKNLLPPKEFMKDYERIVQRMAVDESGIGLNKGIEIPEKLK